MEKIILRIKELSKKGIEAKVGYKKIGERRRIDMERQDRGLLSDEQEKINTR